MTSSNGSPRDVGQVSGEIETLRHELGRLVSELDRRRHEMLDVRRQIRRHPGVVIAAAAVAAIVLGSLLGVSLRRRHQRTRPSVRARETRHALARLLDHPERVAAEPNIAAKIATAAGVAAGSAIAKRLAERFVSRAMPRR